MNIIPACKKVGLHSPKIDVRLTAVKKKDRFIILKVIVIIMGQVVRKQTILKIVQCV